MNGSFVCASHLRKTEACSQRITNILPRLTRQPSSWQNSQRRNTQNVVRSFALSWVRRVREQPAKGANHGTQHHLQKQQRGSRSEIPGIHRLARRGVEQGQVLLDAHRRSLGPRGTARANSNWFRSVFRAKQPRREARERFSFLREERDE